MTDNPHEDPNIRGDAFKTLVVARLDYKADEQDLEREFGRYGPIERVSNTFLRVDDHEADLGRSVSSGILMPMRREIRSVNPIGATLSSCLSARKT